MMKLLVYVLTAITVAWSTSIARAEELESVKGHWKGDTWVEEYCRTKANGTEDDNFETRGLHDVCTEGKEKTSQGKPKTKKNASPRTRVSKATTFSFVPGQAEALRGLETPSYCFEIPANFPDWASNPNQVDWMKKCPGFNFEEAIAPDTNDVVRSQRGSKNRRF